MKSHATAASVAIILALSGCATPRLAGVPPGARISVEIEPDRYGRSATIGIVNANVGTGAKAGMRTGAVIGVLGALGCGPWFPICAGVFGAAGMGSGALIGTVAGAAVGPAAETQAEVIESARRRDAAIRADLVAAIRQKLATRWDVAAGAAPTRLKVSLDRASMVMDGHEFMALAVRASVTFERDGGERDEPAPRRTYDYKGLPAHSSVWTEHGGARIDEALRKAYEHIAEAVYLELAH